MLQRHPDHWKDPETFWPERWLDKEATAQRHCFVHNPFSGGGRNCIGQRFAQIEAKLIIANLVKAFDIRLAPCMADQEMSFSLFLTMKSKTPIKICVVQPRGCVQGRCHLDWKMSSRVKEMVVGPISTFKCVSRIV